MAENPQEGITQLLLKCSGGDQGALDRLIPYVYDELHRLAHRYIKQERSGHTLQTTALVNEAYLRLVDQRQVRWQNRAHFFGIAARSGSRQQGGSTPVALAGSHPLAGAEARRFPTSDETLPLAEAKG